MFDNIKKEILSGAAEYFDSDRDKILDAMQQIFMLNARARREGILALEDGLDEMENKYLQYFLRQVVDGMDQKLIEEFIENVFYASSLSGLDALLFLIAAYGALYIQSGCSEYAITALFQSFVPFEFHKDIYYKYGTEC